MFDFLRKRKKSSSHIQGNKIVVVNKMQGDINVTSEIPISAGIEYLQQLKEEVEANLEFIMKGSDSITTASDFFKIDVWEIVKSSGFTSYLAEIKLLKGLKDFYQSLIAIRKDIEGIMTQAQLESMTPRQDKYDAWLSEGFFAEKLQKMLRDVMLPKIKKAYEQGQGLPEKLEQAIQNLEEIS